MNEAVIAQKNPYVADVVEGKSYYWCQCGQSANQPFCDGSHKGTTFNPVVFMSTETKIKYFCVCKATSNERFFY